MRATQYHTPLPWSALAAITVAALIGGAPIATLILLSPRLGAF